ncbi:ATPase [Mycobacterium sp.]|uniref:ATPase n=1 Tax=Mycobacterium sp. TaxID=1785 RepID=UPI003D6AA231
MRVILATMLLAGGVLAGPVPGVVAHAEPEACPPVCDQIPDTAWIGSQAIPLNSTYRWPSLAAAAVPITGRAPRFRFEELCATPPSAQDTRDSAVGARAVVSNPEGQWQLQAQVLHWRGDTARGGQNATSVFNAATAALRGCQLGAPAQSPSVTVDGLNRLAAVISGPVIMHTYLVAHPQSSTVSELTLWSSAPPQVSWPVILDDQVLDAMTAPLCTAYIGSCP